MANQRPARTVAARLLRKNTTADIGPDDASVTLPARPGFTISVKPNHWAKSPAANAAKPSRPNVLMHSIVPSNAACQHTAKDLSTERNNTSL